MLKMIFKENLTFDALGMFCIGESVNFETGRRAGGWACTHALTGTH